MLKAKKSHDVYIILSIVVIRTIISYILCSFPKVLSIYWDELIYYDIAESIFNGDDIRIYGIPYSGFNNVLYSITLVPAFFIKDTILRIKCITLINSFFNALVIVPVYLICKELKVNRGYIKWIILIIFLWPDALAMSMGFMSENLYFPLSVYCYYCCIKLMRNKHCGYAVWTSIISLLAIGCRVIGVCIPLAFLATEFIYIVEIILRIKKNNNGIDSAQLKVKLLKELKLLFAFLLTYAVVVLIVLLMGHLNQTLYVAAAVLSVKSLSKYKLLYTLYASIQYIILAVVAFGGLTIIVPLGNYKLLSVEEKKSYLFEILLLLGTIFVAVLTVNNNETLGAIIPTVHIRYLYSIIGIALPVLFIDNNIINFYSKRNVSILCIVSGMMVLYIKGLGADTCVAYFGKIAGYFTNISLNADTSVIFYTGGKIALVIISAVLLAVLIYSKFNLKRAIYTYLVLFVCVCLLNCVSIYENKKKIYNYNYEIDEKSIDNMNKINQFFIENNLNDANVLYISNGKLKPNSKIFDTYFDAASNEYTLCYDEFVNILYGDEPNYSKIDFVEKDRLGVHYNIEQVDYYIIPDSAAHLMKNVANVEQLEYVDGGGEFLLYKNNTPTKIERINDKYIIKINFADVDSNAPLFTSGISVAEGEFTWTLGNELRVYSENMPSGDYNVQIKLHDTYNGLQNYYITQKDEILTNGSVEGESLIDFNIKVENDCEFVVHLPDAISPAENEGTSDTRILALSLEMITIESN